MAIIGTHQSVTIVRKLVHPQNLLPLSGVAPLKRIDRYQPTPLWIYLPAIEIKLWSSSGQQWLFADWKMLVLRIK